jgi:hypothetical protein
VTDRPHAKLAADTWRLIRGLLGEALAAPDAEEDLDRDAAMESIIEIACDAAAESADRWKRPRGV